MRPRTSSFNGHVPSNKIGQRISRAIKPLAGRRSLVSKKIPPALMFRVLPDPLWSTDFLFSRLYSSSNLIRYLRWRRWSDREVFNGATASLRMEPGDIFLPFDLGG